MNVSINTFLLFLFFYLMSVTLTAQHADIEGDARIVGKLNIINAVGDSNVFIGANAGINNTAGTISTFGPFFEAGIQNTFVGTNSGWENKSGDDNSFFGRDAGRQNETGSRNCFFGSNAGSNNESGSSNSFFGAYAGKDNESGHSNSFFGLNAGSANVSGRWNSFFGCKTGTRNIDGGANSFFGFEAGEKNTTGDSNSFFGREAGHDNTNGNRNTYIGRSADKTSAADSLDRSIAIGYNAKVNCSNCAVIGGTGVDAVKVGVGTTSPTAELDVRGDGSFFDLFASEITTDNATFSTVDVNKVIKLKPLSGMPYTCTSVVRGTLYYTDSDKLMICTKDIASYNWTPL